MFSEAEISAIYLSLKVAVASAVFSLIPALFFGWLLARKRFPGKILLDGLINLPLVLPPVTTGYLLLLLLGRRSFIGSLLDEMGIRLSFTLAGAIVASIIVSFPLVVRAVRISIEMSDPGLEDAAKTLGASPFITFLTVTLPLSLPGLISGGVLGFARSLGEFGATITFAGNIAGDTQTIPLAVYSFMQVPGGESQAGRLVIISIVISFAALALSELLVRRTRNQTEVK